MPKGLIQILRARWLVWGAHGALWVLFYLSLMNLGGRTPDLRDDPSYSQPALSPAPVAKLESLFASSEWPASLVPPNTLNPFFTRYFVPPPSPAPPPPPTTRKIELTYQGFFQVLDSPKRVLVKIGDAFVSAAVGGPVANKLYVVDATLQSLVLTNEMSQTNLVPLNVKKEIEIPIQ